MRIYVASKVVHAPQWKHLRDVHKINITSSWIDESGPGQTDSMRELWGRIEAEIDLCDRLVLYVEMSDQPLKGAFVEVGMALAMGKPVWIIPKDFIIGPNSPSLGSWVNHPSVSVLLGTMSEKFEKAFGG